MPSSQTASVLPRHCIDEPTSETKLLNPLGVSVLGWVQDHDSNRLRRVECWIDGHLAGSTEEFAKRSDVSQAFSNNNTYVGFDFIARASWAVYRTRSRFKCIAIFERETAILTTLELTWLPSSWLDSLENDATLLDPLGFKLEGWIQECADRPLSRIEFWVDGQLAGGSQRLFSRPDIAPALNTDNLYYGFTFFAGAPWAVGKKSASCLLMAVCGNNIETVRTLDLQWSPTDYRQLDYGSLADVKNSTLHHRNTIYTSGPSAPAPSPECLRLVQRYSGSLHEKF